MQIREAEIYSFGKFQGRKIRFEPGVNVIYGANEAGKSTLHAFLVAMLFGMEKGRGRALQTEGYQRYEPWHAPAYYSGALRFEVDGKPFYLERNFYHKEKREFLRNEADGEELSVTYGDLAMLLGGIQKETFGNTYDISQSGAITGKELADSLAEYLSDASESGNSGFRVTRAVGMLREKKKKLTTELKNVQDEKSRRVSALTLEQEILQRDLLKLREDIARAERQMPTGQTSMRTEAGEQSKTDVQTEVRGEKRRSKMMMVLTGVLLAGAIVMTVANAAIYQRDALQMPAFVMMLFAVVFGSMAAVLFYRYRRMADREALSLAEQQAKARQQMSEAEKQTTGAEQLLAILRESAKEKETHLYNITEQLEQLAVQEPREQELQQEIDAVVMAAGELERLAKEFCEEAGDVLNAEVSRYISAITQGRYDSVRVDEKGKLWALVDGREVAPDALSRGTLEQFYMALRLAVGKTVTGEEVMPIFLDDAFVLYDDDRLRRTLQVLSEMGTQILLFTCQKREAAILSDMGISYHLINLETD